jgi:pyruvate/2-oxoacid:ferredoxin oxidoreductase beta subunit
MLAHDAPYVATCSVAYPEDIFAKVKKATNKENQPPHPLYHPPYELEEYPSMSVEVARQAVTCGMCLWEYERGTFATVIPKK